MLTTRLLICLGIVALATPAFCAQFFIVQEAGMNQCAIAEQDSGSVVVFGDGASGNRPPTGSGTVIVGDGAYGDRPTAEADRGRIVACAGNGQQSALTTPGQFFIVQEPGTNRCTISGQPPADGYGTIVGDGAYGDQTIAEGEAKKVAACAGVGP
jgi:hypothetical protein